MLSAVNFTLPQTLVTVKSLTLTPIVSDFNKLAPGPDFIVGFSSEEQISCLKNNKTVFDNLERLRLSFWPVLG
jgi:hypothetical protein